MRQLVQKPLLLCITGALHIAQLHAQILYPGWPDCTCVHFSPQDGCSSCPCEPLPEYTVPIYWWGSDPCTYYEDHPHVLVFADDFDGTDLDRTKWSTYYPISADGSDQCQYCRTHGEENQVYLDENVTVSNGMLHLTAKYQPTNWMGAQRDYTSGMIHSKSPWKFQKGRFEIRCRIPESSIIGYDGPVPIRDADALWPAFWLFGGPVVPSLGETSTEIDIMEICGESQDEWMGTMHRKYGDCPYHAEVGRVPLYDFADGNFHTFACEWDHWFISFIVDGTHRWRYPKLMTIGGDFVTGCGALGQGTYMQNPRYPDPNALLNVIANLAIQREDANFCSTQTPMQTANFPKVMDIDYIYVWQREPWVQTFPKGCSYYEQHQNIIFAETHKQQATQWIAAGRSIIPEAEGAVIASTSSNVIFRSGQFIDLFPGFSTDEGANFVAEIGECILPRSHEWQVGDDPIENRDGRLERNRTHAPPTASLSLTVSPNPSHGRIVTVVLSSNNGLPVKGIIALYTLDGIEQAVSPIDGHARLDLTPMAAGTYVLKVHLSTHNFTKSELLVLL